MMFLSRFSPKKKKVLFVAGAVASIVFILLGVWLGLAMRARTQFTEAVHSFRDTAKQQLVAQAQPFEALNKTPDAQQSLNRITETEQLASKLLQEVPTEPRVLAVGVATAEAEDKANTLRQWLFDLQRATQQSKQWVAYKTTVFAALKELAGKQGTTLEEQKALVAAWKGVHAKLKAITPPDSASTVHAQLVNNVESISATMASLPELFEKKDRAGFVAKQQELESKLSGLRSLSETYQLLSRDIDKAIATPLKALTS